MRSFGFELEFSSSRVLLGMGELQARLRQVVSEQGQSITGNETSRSWTLKTDHCGYEFTSPAMSASRRSFDKVWHVVNGLRRICNENRPDNLPRHQNVCHPSCGFHVHIGIGDLNGSQMRNLVNIFRTYEDAILALHAPSRRGNGFVRLLQDRNGRWECLNPGDPRNRIPSALGDHYNALNFGRYSQRQTIEIRYGSATLVGRKVVNWIQLLVLLVEIAKSCDNVSYQSNQGVDELKQFITTHETGTWLDRRRRILAQWIDRRVGQLAAYQTAREDRRGQRQIQSQNVA